MMPRLCLAVALLGPGCQVLLPEPGQPASRAASNLPGAQGVSPDDVAVAGDPPAESPPDDALDPDSDLGQVVACLKRGDDAAACPFLAKHISEHPDHVSLRAQYAELLLNLNRLSEARDEFERFTAVAQERGEGLLPLMIHSHSRLLELAERREDDYEIHLQRGMGLFWLAKRSVSEDLDAELPAEGLFFKAAAELVQAHQLQPEQARPCWYLYLIWRNMARQQPAQRWLRDTCDLAGESYLTPGEQRRLHLACQARTERR